MKNEYSNAYQMIVNNDQSVARPEVFDPALQHFPYGFRLGSPKFPDATSRRTWYAAHQRVMDHLLRLIAGSAWNELLVLRGSLLLKAWLGDIAREPGDIDWVFRLPEISLDSPMSQKFQEQLIKMVRKHPIIGDITILVDAIAVDSIWTYERAAGRRIVFPWRIDGYPLGSVQMDIVFGEELFVAPIQTAIPDTQGNSTTVWTASKELSLAWKLLWLQTDFYPQGKDLYDAALLAEQASLSPDLLYRVLNTWENMSPITLPPNFPMLWKVDWDNFKREYSWVQGEAIDWQTHLTLALTPLLEQHHKMLHSLNVIRTMPSIP